MCLLPLVLPFSHLLWIISQILKTRRQLNLVYMANLQRLSSTYRQKRILILKWNFFHKEKYKYFKLLINLGCTIKIILDVLKFFLTAPYQKFWITWTVLGPVVSDSNVTDKVQKHWFRILPVYIFYKYHTFVFLKLLIAKMFTFFKVKTNIQDLRWQWNILHSSATLYLMSCVCWGIGILILRDIRLLEALS